MYTIERTIGNSHIGADGNIKISAVVDLFQDCCGFQLDCCPVTGILQKVQCGDISSFQAA